MNKEHHYKTTVVWTGNRGEGTTGYRNYDRSHEILIAGKETIKGSSDSAFLGDSSKHNPEDLLVASLSVCHMLWYLHLCADKGIIVTAYEDKAEGIMLQTSEGGKFISATLYPEVIITDEKRIEEANQLHHEANKHCFIANSVNFPVSHKPTCKAGK